MIPIVLESNLVRCSILVSPETTGRSPYSVVLVAREDSGWEALKFKETLNSGVGLHHAINGTTASWKYFSAPGVVKDSDGVSSFDRADCQAEFRIIHGISMFSTETL